MNQCFVFIFCFYMLLAIKLSKIYLSLKIAGKTLWMRDKFNKGKKLFGSNKIRSLITTCPCLETSSLKCLLNLILAKVFSIDNLILLHVF